MKLIIAVIQPDKLSDVKEALTILDRLDTEDRRAG